MHAYPSGPGRGSPPAGQRLGRYRLAQRIGEGGMGVVHLGVDDHGTAVAIKVLRPHIAGDPEARRRLGREVDSLRRVRHPRVAEVLDADVDGEMPYVVTQFVPGMALDDHVKEHGPLTGTALARLGNGLGEALAAIHAAGVVHRDLKPGNVLMLDGDPVVIDFGIAHVADDVRLTSTGLIMGTPGYLSPELVEGDRVDQATDWWGWAATMTFAATGRPPFGRGPMEVVLDRVRRGSADLGGVPAVLVPVLEAALSVDPARRPAPGVLRKAVAALEEASLRVEHATPGSPAVVREVGRGSSVAGADEVMPFLRPGPNPATVIRAETGRLPVPEEPPTQVVASAGHHGFAKASADEVTRMVPAPPGRVAPAAAAPVLGEAATQVVSERPVEPRTTTLNVAPGTQVMPAVGVTPSGHPSAQAFAPSPHLLPPHYRQQNHRQPAVNHPQNQLLRQPGSAAAPGWPQPEHVAVPPYRSAGPPQPGSTQPGSTQPGSAQPGSAAGRPRRTAVVVMTAVALSAVAAVVPLVAALVGIVAMVTARTVDRTAGAVHRRRYEHGSRRGDGARALASSPWHLVMAVVVTVPALLLPLLVGASVAFIVGLANPAGPAPGDSIPLSAGSLAAAVTAWGGPGGGSLRRGSRAVARAVTPGTTSANVVVALLAVVAAGALLAAASGGWQPEWTPLEQAPFTADTADTAIPGSGP